MKPRISMRVLIALVALISVVLAVARWNDPVVRYRRNHDEASLHAVLSRRVANGDSIEAVEAILGRGVVSTDPKMRQMAASLALSAPMAWPEGVIEGDEFRRYPAGEGLDQVLQFRGGHLVNFNPKQIAGLLVEFHEVSREAQSTGP
jgi:hypothetical protein